MLRYVQLQIDEVVREMATAFLLVIAGESVWMPRSQVYRPQRFHSGQYDVQMMVTHDVAEKKGLLQGI